MIIPREKIYAALFALGKRITWKWNPADPTTQQWAYASRHVQNWDASPNQPAFYQRQMGQGTSQQGSFGASKFKLRVEWWIYFKANNADAEGQAPSQKINPLMDAIDAALQPPTLEMTPGTRQFGLPGQGQSLMAFNNGVPLVENVWIDGEVLMDDPVGSDSQVILLVPLSISTGM